MSLPSYLTVPMKAINDSGSTPDYRISDLKNFCFSYIDAYITIYQNNNRIQIWLDSIDKSFSIYSMLIPMDQCFDEFNKFLFIFTAFIFQAILVFV